LGTQHPAPDTVSQLCFFCPRLITISFLSRSLVVAAGGRNQP
jgi:hypothetical protein